MRYMEIKIHINKKFYYRVYIFLQKRSMYKFRDNLVKDGARLMKKPHRYLACCSVWHSKKDKNQWGVLVFTKSSAKKAGIVSHEFCHATNYWFAYQKKNNIYKQCDEAFALLLGNLVKEYWNAWYTLPKRYRQ